MFDFKSIVYVLSVIFLLIILLILKKEYKYLDFKKDKDISKKYLYNFIVDSLEIINILYISNRIIDANKYLNKNLT